MKRLIYATDDDKSTRELISSFLESEGFSVASFKTGDALLDAFQKAKPDLVILDIVMPGTDGLTVCSRLRRSYPSLPILIVSAMDSPYDRVTGLTMGCDDYLTKPFLPLELAARIRALLRRTQAAQEATGLSYEGQVLSFGPLRLLTEQRVAFLGETRFPLTPAEFDFLSYLINSKGNAVSRKELLKNLWDLDWQADTRVTDDLVKRLRRKLRDAGSPVQIETVWGFGFRLSMEDESELKETM